MSSQAVDGHTGRSTAEVEHGLSRSEAPPGCEDARSLPQMEESNASRDATEAMMSIHPDMLPLFTPPEITSVPTWHTLAPSAFDVPEHTFPHMFSPPRNPYATHAPSYRENHEISLPAPYGYMATPLPTGAWNMPDSHAMAVPPYHNAVSRAPNMHHQAYVMENTMGGYYPHPSAHPASKDLLGPSIIEGSESSNQSDTASTASHGAPSPPDVPNVATRVIVSASGVPINHMILSHNKHDLIGAVTVTPMPHHHPHHVDEGREVMDDVEMDDDWDDDNAMPASPSHYQLRYQMQQFHREMGGAQEQRQQPQPDHVEDENSVDGMGAIMVEASNPPIVLMSNDDVEAEHQHATQEMSSSTAMTPSLPSSPLVPSGPLPSAIQDEIAARLELRKSAAVPSRRSRQTRTSDPAAPKPAAPGRSKSTTNLARNSPKKSGSSASLHPGLSTPTSKKNSYPSRSRTQTISAAEAASPSSSRPSPPYSAPVSRGSLVASPSSPSLPRTPPLERAATGPIERRNTAYSYATAEPEPITLVPLRIGETDYQVSHKQASRIIKRLACRTRPNVQSQGPPLTPSRAAAADRRTRSGGKFERENKSNSPSKPPK